MTGGRRGVDPVLFGIIAAIAIVATAVAVVLFLRDDDNDPVTAGATTTIGQGDGGTTTTVDGPSSTPTSSPAGVSEDIEDGRHFGYFESVTIGDVTATGEFDLALFFTGQAAIDAAAEDGIDDYDLDYYIRNENDRLRTLVLDPHAEVTVIDYDNCCDAVDSNVPSFAVEITPERGCWVTVTNGIVTKIEEQFLP